MKILRVCSVGFSVVVWASLTFVLTFEAVAGTFSSTFNSRPAGTTLYGSAAIDRTGGFNNSGVLRLTLNEPDREGAFVIGDLDSGKSVRAFTASFKLRIGGGTGGQGFSFNFAPDLPDSFFGEEGTGLGLTVSFDTVDNGGGEGPAIDVKFRGATVASRRIIARTGERFVDVQIKVDPDGTVDVVFDGSVVHANIHAFTPLAGRFGLGARTGTRTDAHLVDDLEITTEVLNAPFVRLASPSGEGARPNPLIQVELRDFNTDVNRTSVAMSLNGNTVPATISKSGSTTKIQYQVPGFLPSGSSNSVSVVYADDSNPPIVQELQFDFVVEPYSTLPASFAVSPGAVDTSKPGFNLRTVQARIDAALAPTLARAEAQLAGKLIDPATGQPFLNEARPGSNPDKSFDEPSVINYEKDGNPSGNFLNNERRFPGLPGTGGHTVNAAMEIRGFLDLPAGYHRFGVSSDDGFKVTAGEGDVRDAFSMVLGQFDGSRSVADTFFSVLADSPGLYPVRLIWYQSGGGGSLEFYSVQPDGKKVLVNDRSNPAAIKAHAASALGAAAKPYVELVDPRPGATGVSRKPQITVVLQDGQASVVASSIQLALNGKPATPAVTQTNGTTTIRFQPAAELPGLSLNTVSLTYRDNGSPSTTTAREWTFTTAREVKITGQWDFDGGFTATFGADAPMPGGDLQAATAFGNTAQFEIPALDGAPVRVLKYTRIEDVATPQPGYVVHHGIEPNGGGTKVNEWTLVMDVLFPDPQVSPFSSLVQLNDITTSGDLFVRWNDVAGPGTGGIGVDGQYTGSGRTALTIGKWHRIVIAVDMASTSPVISKYIDGMKFEDQTFAPPQRDGRFSLDSSLRLFADDDNEVNTVYVNSVQVLDGKLTDDEVAALGGPSSEGIPLPNRVMGQWDFENRDLRATIGYDLEFFGITGTNAVFNSTASLRIPGIQGQPANVLFVPDPPATAPNRDFGLIMPHGMRPNGGGSKVNTYTLLMDLFLASTNETGLFSFLQTDTDNSTDGDLFFRASDGGIGQGEGGYEGNTRMQLQQWHRVAFAVNLAAQPPVISKFIDGVKHSDWIQTDGVDVNRRALLPTAILFADDDGERMPAYVNSVQIRSGKLSDQQIRALGQPAAGGIPINIPAFVPINPPTLSARLENGQIHLSWPADGVGFILESADALNGTWTPVPDVVNRSIAITPDATSPVRFYRLRSL